MWQNIGYILIGLGALALTGWAAWSFFTTTDIPLLIRIALGVIGLGVLVLAVIAIKDRIGKKDDFEEVDN
jgi:hypothetical protein